MSATALRMDDWWLAGFDATGLLKVSETKDADGKVVSQTFYRRPKIVLQLVRRLYGVTAFSEDVDKTLSAFSYRTGPDTVVAYASTGRKFICTGHKLVPTSTEAGEADEQQTWEFYGKWEEVADTTFTG
jgi:hypothetical protein